MAGTTGMRSRSRLSIVIVMCVTSIVTAGDHWYSRPLTSVPPGNLGIRKFVTMQHVAGDNVGMRSDYAQGPIDLVVSLEGNPDGDNDRETIDDRTAYEEIFEHFADAIFEATNGGHVIRTVRIFPNGRFSNSADVVWQAAPLCPSADTAGWGVAGRHIYMANTFDVDVQIDALAPASRRSAGYVLAHEFCHYAYGLYDEYRGHGDPEGGSVNPRVPWLTDVSIAPSIMANPWLAAYLNDIRHLNFSIPYTSPISVFNDTRLTAQHRIYRASCWETLVRDASEDPRAGNRWARPRRIQWTDLINRAPSAAAGWNQDLPNLMARGALNVIWMHENVAYELVIDRSRSMHGERIENAKTAARFLVDIVPIGSLLGVVEFNETQNVVHDVVALNSQEDRDSVKEAISRISEIGNTDIQNAAIFGLNQINAAVENATKVVFLLSDGRTSVPTISTESVIADYQAAGVPLFTFGYGGLADEVLLRTLAEQTGGRYYYSPVTLSEIIAVFADASRRASGGSNIMNGKRGLSPGQIYSRNFPVDDTIALMNVTVTFTGALTDAAVVLRSPGGVAVSETDAAESVGVSHVRFRVESPDVGTWNLHVSSSDGADISFTYDVSVDKADDAVGYTLTLENQTGPVVEYPEPIVLTAVLKKTRPIAGAVVIGEIVLADGTRLSLPFRDDGVAPDAFANDGHYSAAFAPASGPSSNGVYEIRVSAFNAGNAELTSSGLQVPAPDGLGVIVPNQPVLANFERMAVLQVELIGMQSDDHGDRIDDATQIPNNNTDVPGRIDTAGDIDVFAFSIPVVERIGIVRMSDMALGMRPRMRVIRHDGLLVADELLTSTEDGDVGQYLRIPSSAGAGETYYVEISHASAIGTGTYSISAGPPMAVELEDINNIDRDGDGVINELDGCPDNPDKVLPGVCGCGLNDGGDRDGDGILDCVDACPDAAAGTNGTAQGCPPSDETQQPQDELEQSQPVITPQSLESNCGCGAGAAPLAPLGLIGFLGMRRRMRTRRADRKTV